MKKELINLSDLRLSFLLIFEYLEKNLGVYDVELNSDYYWGISCKEKYNMKTEPQELLVGQLCDDWEALASILKDEERATPLMLMHLAPLLDYLATEVDWFKKSSHEKKC